MARHRRRVFVLGRLGVGAPREALLVNERRPRARSGPGLLAAGQAVAEGVLPRAEAEVGVLGVGALVEGGRVLGEIPVAHERRPPLRPERGELGLAVDARLAARLA